MDEEKKEVLQQEAASQPQQPAPEQKAAKQGGKQVDPKKFHAEYLDWKKEIKGGKVRYYLNNVLFTGLLFTAVFAVLLVVYNQWAYAWFGRQSGYDLGLSLLIIAIFWVVYSLMLFGIYCYSWKNNQKKFAAYDKAVMALVAKKRGEQPQASAQDMHALAEECDLEEPMEPEGFDQEDFEFDAAEEEDAAEIG